MKILKKIQGESTPDNRRKGQIKTVVFGTIICISQSDVLTPYPLAKTIVDLLAGVVLRDVVKHATTVNK